MGFLDKLLGVNQIPTITTILPVAAKQEIMAGRLPILNADSIFLKRGEKIHYLDKAINQEERIKKTYRHIGHSGPGLFKGTRYNVGEGKPIEKVEVIQHKGILYVTNQRIIFQAKDQGFDKSYRYLTAIQPYSNGCEIQFGNKTYCMIVPDGNCLYEALQQIKQRRQIP